jgi:DNA-binding transcriptional ArsR family regulator
MKNLHHPAREDISLFGILYALSEPVRFSIVEQLFSREELTCGAFKLPSSKGKSTMTHHFKVLRDSGLIFTRVEGREHYTSLRRAEIDARFPKLLDALHRAWELSAESDSVAQVSKLSEPSFQAS